MLLSSLIRTRISLSLLTLLIGVSVHAAGPKKVATYDRSLWPHDINSPQAFNTASRYENLMFASVLAELPPAIDDAFLMDYTGRKKVNSVSAQAWILRTQDRVAQNIRMAKCKEKHKKGKKDKCAKLRSSKKAWLKVKKRVAKALAKLPDEYQPWKAAARGFYQTYSYEQLRLAALFPRITSEIDQLIPAEHTGFEWQDGEFLLSFDDGPTKVNHHTDHLLDWLSEHQTTAIFFALGERLQARTKAQSQADLAKLYAGQCLASHGFEHKSHANAERWPDSIKKTRAQIQSILEHRQPVSFRPPYGQRSSELSLHLYDLKEPLVLWNIDSQDWNRKLSADNIAHRVEALMLLWRRGTLLFHDIHPKALPAMERLHALMKANNSDWMACDEALARMIR